MTRDERAIKIAEFEGFKEEPNLAFPFQSRTSFWNTERTRAFENENDVIDYFSSFNGLMPIVERVNNKRSVDTGIVITKYEIQVYFTGGRPTSVFVYNDSKYPLIDALQAAIIYYHENRGEQ